MEQVTEAESDRHFTAFCHAEADPNASLSDYCDCEGANFTGQHFSNVNLTSFNLTNSAFRNVTFTNVTFSNVSLESCNFTGCVLDNVSFESRSTFHDVNWDQMTFNRVNVSGLSVCNGSVSESVESVGDGEGGSGEGDIGELGTVLLGETSASCEDVEVECEGREKGSHVYRDLFLVSGSAFPGNIASAIAVYFMRRNYWMGRPHAPTVHVESH